MIINLPFLGANNAGVSEVLEAVQKKNMLVFLEGHNTLTIAQIVKRFHNLGVTEGKQLIIIPDAAMKHCPMLGIRVGFGDIYRGIAVPKEVVKARTSMQEYGFSDEEISWFFKEVHDKSGGQLKQSLTSKIWNIPMLFKKNTNELVEIKGAVLKDAAGKDVEKKDAEFRNVEKTMYDVYTTLSFAVKDFILSGMNQTTIVSEMRNLVAQRELENMNKIDWKKYLGWAIIIAIVLLFAPDVIKALQGGAPAAAPPPLPTNPLAGVIGK